MRKILFVLVLFAAHLPSHAQTGWFPLKTLISKNMVNVYFINADTGFVLTAGDGNWRTSDGGQTWNEIPAYGSKIKFFNNARLGFNYSAGAIFKTTDHGVSWSRHEPPEMYTADVEFPSDSVGYMIHELSSDDTTVPFAKTTDGGMTWTKKHILPSQNGYRIEGDIMVFRDENHGFVVKREYDKPISEPNHFAWLPYFTTDGGETWRQQGGNWYRALHATERTWVFSTWSGAIYKSNDDMISDSVVSLNAFPPGKGFCRPERFLAKCLANDSIIFSINKSSIYKSSDMGESWYLQLCKPIDGWDAGISIPTENVGYAVGIDSQVYKTIDGGGPPLSVVGVKPCDCEITATPNPAGSFIEFAIDDLAHASLLDVFDALGRRMAREAVAPQATSHRLDVHGYPPGVYYARIGSQTVRFIKQ